MTGVFDRLQREIESKEQAGGVTALDLAELNPAMRRIIRTLLRELEMNYLRLRAAMDEMPVEERLSHTDLHDALEILTRQCWLTRTGTGELAIYKVNLRRRSAGSVPAGIWAILDAKLKSNKK